MKNKMKEKNSRLEYVLKIQISKEWCDQGHS